MICPDCKGKGSIGTITNGDTEVTRPNECWRCEGTGEYESSLAHRIEKNIWDHVNDIIPAIASALKDKKWSWARSKDFKCKYIDVRIDMRSGHCLLLNSDNERISIEDLQYQYESRSSE